MFIETTNGEFVNLRYFQTTSSVPKNHAYLMLHSEEFGSVKVWREEFENLTKRRHVIAAEPGITAFLINEKVDSDEEPFDFLGTVIAWSVDTNGCHSAIIASWGEPLNNVGLLFSDGHVETMSTSRHGEQKFQDLEAARKCIHEAK